MAQPFKVIVTDKTNFEQYNALDLGDVLTFTPDTMEYRNENGEVGEYSNTWLKLMLLNGSFEFVPEDEPLPPAPESVAYAETGSPLGTDAILRIGKSKFDGLLLLELVATRHVDGARAAAGMRLDVDDALQLAHDLRRMAMEIKRNQKEAD